MAHKPTKWELFLEDVPTPLKNKFIVATAVFVVWMLFFDNNSAIDQYRLQSTLQGLKDKKAYHDGEIKKAEKSHQELFTSDKTKEKFARETYFMKKSDEDVFVIDKPQSK